MHRHESHLSNGNNKKVEGGFRKDEENNKQGGVQCSSLGVSDAKVMGLIQGNPHIKKNEFFEVIQKLKFYQ